MISCVFCQQPESDGSRSGSSLSLRNIPPQVGSGGGGGSGGGTGGAVQSPSHRGVHRSISASNPKPSRRASSGGETLRKSLQPTKILITHRIDANFLLSINQNQKNNKNSNTKQTKK